MRANRKMVVEVRATFKDFVYCIIALLILTGILDASFKNFKNTIASPVKAIEEQPVKIIEKIVVVPDTTGDSRAIKLKDFLEYNKSPLAPYAQIIVDDADKYDIGWTKLVSISKIESDLGKKLPQDSHNAWGLGGSNFMRFKDWPTAIHFASKLIGENYQHGQNQAIKEKYCPSSDNCNPAWAKVVTDVSRQILAEK